jgi:maltooligosyltrehalose trehalohydrolase
MHRAHSMPFGAEVQPDGTVRFRLWAPAAERVDIVLDGRNGERRQPLARLADGWYELISDTAGAGTHYRYQIDAGAFVPDPASRCNPQDVHGPSVVVDPREFHWDDAHWRGRPWHEAVIYELHVGAFDRHGTFAAVQRRLDELVRLGVTAIELMPVADFPGRRNWGYDGVLWFAPDASYGSPADLKRLIEAAHARGLMVQLDVVYNHFGPEGNYLHLYAPQFFTARHHTPWGAAINFDDAGSRTVRDFCIHNALYWLEEFHFDGLRIDAVHAIRDDTTPDIVLELAAAVRSGPGRTRHVHLVLENHDNESHYLGADPGSAAHCDAQWNDDEHHCLHVILTGESDGYYADYTAAPHALLRRCLTEGFAYQGEPCVHQDGRRRGEPSAHLRPTAFVPFLQNHDQIGNRAHGERLCHLLAERAPLRAATALLLLAPAPPLLFMGEEWAAPEPFPYFCDFEPDLAARVRAGRRREFARFSRFHSEEAWASVPDACDPRTFSAAQLAWQRRREPQHAEWLAFYRRLLRVRHRAITPHLRGTRTQGQRPLGEGGGFAVDWLLGNGATLSLLANLTAQPVPLPPRVAGRLLFTTHPAVRATFRRGTLEPWCVTWLLTDRHA